MKHIRIALLAYSVFMLVTTCIAAILQVFISENSLSDTFFNLLYIFICLFLPLLVSFAVYRFIFDFLQEKRHIKMPFPKRMLVALALSAVYAVITNFDSFPRSSVMEILKIFGIYAMAGLYLALMYELAVKIAMKFEAKRNTFREKI